MTAKTDNDLALLWKSGAEEAYNELVRRHLEPIHRYVRSRCGNDSDASDICQDVFLEVCLKISNFDPAYPFSAWLHMIARHKAVDRFRRQRPVEEFQAAIHSGMDSSHPSLILEEHEAALEAWEKVFRLLPEAQATALWLRVQGQQSIEEISVTLSQSVANVKVLLFRARQRLAKEWRPANLIQS
ncbi:MAG: sigma-70 family RNA polymerase sigma factor [Akkermansiaceae bacterium]|nr:sigma-70 family RNA polymerase sigma factor [Akkermansiaceae bacterium]